MPAGAVPLSDYPRDVVELAGSKCERRGRYPKDSLAVIHGPGIGLPDLRTRVAANCPRMRNPFGNDLCGVYYPELAQLP